jgi:hypothetical protein
MRMKLTLISHWGAAHNTGVTCIVGCLHTAKNARSRVPQLCSGVYYFFDEVEKIIRMRKSHVQEASFLLSAGLSRYSLVW